MRNLLILLLMSLLAGCGIIDNKPDVSISNHFMKGETAYANKKYSVAKYHFKFVLNAYPDNAEALFKLGNISMREKKWGDASIYYNNVIRNKPRHAKAHHNLAILHLYHAKNHLNYYIANNDSFDNKSPGKVISAIDQYSSNRTNKSTPQDRPADVVNAKQVK